MKSRGIIGSGLVICLSSALVSANGETPKNRICRCAVSCDLSRRRQEDIYLDDTNREIYLEVLADVQHRFNWAIHAYCLMSNHYHLLFETPDSNLAKGMRTAKYRQIQI